MHCETLAKRIIACLDVNAGRVVKGIQFEQLRDAGDPAELAAAHSAAGADEIVLLDITATAESRNTLLETVRRTAWQLFIPFTVGGGIRSLDDAAAVLGCGTKAGFDCALTRTIATSVRIPVIASGGAGEPHHFVEVFRDGAADAALAASVFHFGLKSVEAIKHELRAAGIPVRLSC